MGRDGASKRPSNFWQPGFEPHLSLLPVLVLLLGFRGESHPQTQLRASGTGVLPSRYPAVAAGSMWGLGCRDKPLGTTLWEGGCPGVGSESGRGGPSPGLIPHWAGIGDAGVGLVHLGYMGSFIPVPPSWRLLIELAPGDHVGPRGPGEVESAKVLGAGMGVASFQLGVPKQVTAPLWLQLSKLENGVTDVSLG